MIHVDLTGRMDPSIDGYEYGLIMHADFTKVRSAVPIRLKSEAVAAVIAFVARLETQSGIKVKVVRSDLGTEFSLKSYCDRMGVIHQTTPGYTPELNGVAERAVGIIKGQTRALTLSTPLGHAYWNYAMRYAIVIQNKITPSGIEGKTAWEVITGRSANLHSIREYGEVCFAHTPPEIRPRSTLDLPTARQARIIGIDEAVSGYIVRFEDDGSIGRSRDVRSATGLPLNTPLKVPALTPSRQPVRSPPRVVPAPPPPALMPPPVEPPVQDVPQGTGEDTLVPASVSPTEPEQGESTETPTVVQPTSTVPRKVRFTLSSSAEPRRSARINADPSATFINGDNNEYHGSNARTLHLAAESAAILAITPASDEPKSIAEAMRRPDAAQWSAAVESELGNLTGKGTWEEAVLPAGRKVIGCKWVLKTKTDADGNVIKYKARLVAQGFSQQPGIDFEETFAPVGRSTSLRILLTLAAAHNLEIHQADVEGAYLNGDLDRDIYMKIPQAYNQLDSSCNALKLRKTLYGLKQSGREWWKV